jgi:hypothetical protein
MALFKKKPVKDRLNEVINWLQKNMGGEIVVEDAEPQDFDSLLYDKDILNQNIIVLGVTYVGERDSDFGKTKDFDVKFRYEGLKETSYFRTNHAYISILVKLLKSNARPCKVRIMYDEEKRRYFLSAWQKEKTTV